MDIFTPFDRFATHPGRLHVFFRTEARCILTTALVELRLSPGEGFLRLPRKAVMTAQELDLGFDIGEGFNSNQQ